MSRDVWTRPSKTKEFQHVSFKTSSTSTDISSCPPNCTGKFGRSFDPPRGFCLKNIPAVKSCEVQNNLVNLVSKKICPKTSESTSVSSFCLPKSGCNLYCLKTPYWGTEQKPSSTVRALTQMWNDVKGQCSAKKHLQNTFIWQNKARILVNKSMISFRFGSVIPKN